MNLFDLSIPELILGNTVVDGEPAYLVTTCTTAPGMLANLGARS
ncbi:hypothetical protein [Nocardia brasiliensis]